MIVWSYRKLGLESHVVNLHAMSAFRNEYTRPLMFANSFPRTSGKRELELHGRNTSALHASQFNVALKITQANNKKNAT